MRVNVQLIDTGTGNHVWAERFDKPVGDLFDMQDEIVARLARQLGTQLISAEARRAERAPTPDSLDLYFQGMAVLNRGNTPDYLMQARDYFERALELDAGNIEAMVWGAYVDTMKASLYAADDRAARLAAAESGAHQPRCRSRPSMPRPTCSSGWCRSRPTARCTASPRASRRWRTTATSPPRMR